MVPGHEAGPLSFFLRRILRHESFGNGRLGRGDGADGIRQLAERQRKSNVAGGRWSTNVRIARLRLVSWRERRRRPRAGIAGSVRQQGGPEQQSNGRGRRSLRARIDFDPASKDRQRLWPDHAVVPGPGERRAVIATGGVCEITVDDEERNVDGEAASGGETKRDAG